MWYKEYVRNTFKLDDIRFIEVLCIRFIMYLEKNIDLINVDFIFF